MTGPAHFEPERSPSIYAFPVAFTVVAVCAVVVVVVVVFASVVVVVEVLVELPEGLPPKSEISCDVPPPLLKLIGLSPGVIGG